MKILGCLYAAQDLKHTGINGLRIANTAFLDALIRYSSADCIHIFSPPAAIDRLKSQWREAYSSRRIRFFPVYQLAQCLQQVNYFAFHTGEPWIDSLVDMRQMHAPALFPVTGRAHTLSQDIGLKQLQNVMLSRQGAWDSILCSSEASRKVLENMICAAEQHHNGKIEWQGRLDLLPLGVTPFEQPDRKQAREMLGISSDSFVMLGLGRFSAVDKMDLHPLLLAVRELVLGSDRKISLYLAGAGDPGSDYLGSLLSSSYELLVDSAVHFELDIDESRKLMLLAASDVFISVSDSYQESFGIAPVEAMMARCPVVLSDWNGYRELISHGVEGYLVPTSRFESLSDILIPYAATRDSLVQAQTTAIDIESLVKLLKRLMDDKKLCRKMGRAARKKALEWFEWSKLTERYDELTEQLSQLASQQTDWKPCSSRLYATDNFFSHYPTKSLDDHQFYTLTDRGLRVLLGVEQLLASGEVAEAMPLQEVHLVLQYAGDLGKPFSVTTLLSCPELDSVRSRAAVVWMLKYHLLTCATKKEKNDKRLVSGRVKNLLPKIARHAKAVRKQKKYSDLVALLKRRDSLEGETGNTAVSDILLSAGSALLDKVEYPLPGSGDAALIVDLMTPFANWLKTVRWERVPVSPAYSRYLFRVARQWVQSAYDFTARVCSDLPQLCRWVNLRLDNLHSVQFQVMPEVEYFDVVKITFNGTCSVIYKNRDLRIENALLSPDKGLISKLNKWNRSELLKSVPCLCCTDQTDNHYGYMVWIDSDVTADQKPDSWYQGMGALSALALQLGIKDLHENNILSFDGLPCLIDAELMFSPDVITTLHQEVNGKRAVTVEDLDISSLGKTNILDSDWTPAGITSQQEHTIRKGFLIVCSLFRSHYREVLEWKKHLEAFPVRFCDIPEIYQKENLKKIREAYLLPLESEQIRRLGQWLAATGLREQHCAVSEKRKGFRPGQQTLQGYYKQWLKGRVVNQSRLVGEPCQLLYPSQKSDVDIIWEELQKTLVSNQGMKMSTMLADCYANWLRTK